MGNMCGTVKTLTDKVGKEEKNHKGKKGYYTLMLSDLDRPNLDTQAVEEWCHWLVTDIPLSHGEVMTIAGGSSPFVSSDKSEERNEPSIPGRVLLPSIPSHPSNSNPRRIHRYVMTVFEQDAPNVFPSSTEFLEQLTQKARTHLIEHGRSDISSPNQTSTDVKDEKQRPLWESNAWGDRELNELLFRQRGVVPTWGLRTEYDGKIRVAGFAFWTSCWNVHTSDIFTRLGTSFVFFIKLCMYFLYYPFLCVGIHEPVYGALRSPTALVHKLDAATQVASSILQSQLNSAEEHVVSSTVKTSKPLHMMSSKELTHLNHGTKPSLPPVPRPMTISSQKAQSMKQASQSNDKSKKHKPAKSGDVDEKNKRQRARLPRLTVVGSVGLVRSKEHDIAGQVVGEVTKTVMGRRGRFQNV